MKKINYFLFVLGLIISQLLFNINIQAQGVSISNTVTTPDNSAMLDVQATDKGMLIPRVALTGATDNATIASPLTSLLVYNTATTTDLAPGYYFWNGSRWDRFGTGNLLREVTKTSNATISKLETFVLASNDITLTLPVVTSADDGLLIIVKNIGSYKDLITVKGSGSAKIDAVDSIRILRWQSFILVASNGNWLMKKDEMGLENVFDVSDHASFTSISEAIEFLNDHMAGPSIIKLSSDTFRISSTLVINLPYTLTIQGQSYGETTIAAATGLTNKPMFRCKTACSFKMLTFNATTLASYGTLAGEDCIRYLGSGTYQEFKDCSIKGFYNGLLDSTNAELWIFDVDINNCKRNGMLIQGSVSGVKVRVEATDFIDNVKGFNMRAGSSAYISLNGGAYICKTASDTAIIYNPTSFGFSNMYIKGNVWNNVGKYIEGFDFARSDGRDANAIVESNAGEEDQIPHCKINVLNNASTITLTNALTWYKPNWTNSSIYSCKWTVPTGAGVGNSMTYQPVNVRDVWIIITGDLSTDQDNRTISIGIVKNGATGTRYGECDLRITTKNQPFQFSTVIYIPSIVANDYLELYCKSSNAGDIIKFQDIQIFVNSQ